MEYKGLAVQMEAFEFTKDLHVTNANECEVDFDFTDVLLAFRGEFPVLVVPAMQNPVADFMGGGKPELDFTLAGDNR